MFFKHLSFGLTLFFEEKGVHQTSWIRSVVSKANAGCKSHPQLSSCLLWSSLPFTEARFVRITRFSVTRRPASFPFVTAEPEVRMGWHAGMRHELVQGPHLPASVLSALSGWKYHSLFWCFWGMRHVVLNYWDSRGLICRLASLGMQAIASNASATQWCHCHLVGISFTTAVWSEQQPT